MNCCWIFAFVTNSTIIEYKSLNFVERILGVFYSDIKQG